MQIKKNFCNQSQILKPQIFQKIFNINSGPNWLRNNNFCGQSPSCSIPWGNIRVNHKQNTKQRLHTNWQFLPLCHHKSKKLLTPLPIFLNFLPPRDTSRQQQQLVSLTTIQHWLLYFYFHPLMNQLCQFLIGTILKQILLSKYSILNANFCI